MFARALQLFLLAALAGVPSYAFGLEHQAPKLHLEIFESSADTQWPNPNASAELHWENRTAGELIASGCFLAPKAGEADKAAAPARHTPDQEALVELAKRAKKTGVSKEQAETLLDWAKEVGLPGRGPEVHPDRNFDKPHIHIGPVDHIPVRGL